MKSGALRVVAAAGCAAALLLTACSNDVEERAPVIRPVKIMTVQSFEGGAELEYAGVVQAGETADLSFEVPGRLVEYAVIEGQNVNEGDLIARLDPADYEQAVNRADADFRAAEAEFRRYEELVKTGAVARRDVDVKRRDYEVAAASLETARKALRDTRLVAPFSGQIGRTMVENFTNVQAKQPVAVLLDLTRFEVVASIPEQDWARARPGMTLAQRSAMVKPMVTLSLRPDRPIEATLTELATVADPVTRTFQAIGSFDAPEDLQVLPGMTAKVSVSVPADAIMAMPDITVPTSAVVADEQGNPTVWKVDTETMQVSQAPVELGELTGADVAILSGVSPGDRIAVSGANALREGMTVRELNN